METTLTKTMLEVPAKIAKSIVKWEAKLYYWRKAQSTIVGNPPEVAEVENEIAELEEAMYRLTLARFKANIELTKRLMAIFSGDDDMEMLACLMNRYVYCYDVKTTCAVMNYSERWVMKLQSAGLKRIEALSKASSGELQNC